MTTQRYDVPYRKVGRRFVGILSVELDLVRARKWNTEMVILFQSVIKAFIISSIFVRSYCFSSISRIVERLTNFLNIHLMQLRDTRGKLVIFKPGSKVIKRSQTFS